MKFKKYGLNAIANILSRFWGIVGNFIAIPLYIAILDVELYGVIALYTVVIVAINIADAGMSPSFGRDVARIDDKPILRNALKTLEYLYGSIFIIIIILALIFSTFLCELIINTSRVPSVDKASILMLMVISALFQLSTSVYKSGFMGLEKHVKVSVYSITFSILRVFLPLLILNYNADLVNYFLYQAFISAAFYCLLRESFWKELGGRGGSVFDFEYLKSIKKFAGGLLLIAIIAAINMQLDKFMVSYYIDLESLSIYTIAFSIAFISYSVTLPIILTFYPKITKLVADENVSKFSTLYQKLSILVVMINIVINLVVFIFAYDLVLLWIGKLDIAEQTAPLIRVLCVGTFFLNMQLLPYHLGLANGYTKLNVVLGFAFIFITPVMLWGLINQYQALGAAYNWIFVNFTYFILMWYVIGGRFEGRPLSIANIYNSIVVVGVVVATFVIYQAFNDYFHWMISLIVSSMTSIGIIALIYINGIFKNVVVDNNSFEK